MIEITGTIFAFNRGSTAVAAQAHQITCSDIYGNEGGDWIGGLVDDFGLNGNISADPMFCHPETGDLSIRDDSACCPLHNPECGLIGAWPVGCFLAGIDGLGEPAAIELAAAPNPFRVSTRISYEILSNEGGAFIPVSIYDPAGRVIRSFAAVAPGDGHVVWDGSDDAGLPVRGGVYFCRIGNGRGGASLRLIMLR
jgi:hypothetical protein